MADRRAPSQLSALDLMTPADGGAAITPHNTNSLATTTRAIYVGGAGKF